MRNHQMILIDRKTKKKTSKKINLIKENALLLIDKVLVLNKFKSFNSF